MGGLKFLAGRRIRMVSGSMNYGQGHAVAFAQIVGDVLGVSGEHFELLQSDSDELIAGAGTGGSRMVISAGTLLMKAAQASIEKGKRAAAYLFEAAVADIEFAHGAFRVSGTDRAIELFDLVEQLQQLDALPAAVPAILDAELAEDSPPSAFPNGCHVAEVEVDPDTGVVTVKRYFVVDDLGTLINPMLVEGQVQGGVAEGLGQALLEHTVYDDDAQLLPGSFLGYKLPRATDVPDVQFASLPTPVTNNPLGVKGCGEAGTTGRCPQ